MDARARFCFAGEGTQAIESLFWRALAASVAGPSHRRKGKGCDDAAASCADGRWLTAVVCDGAGSAAHGGSGAEMLARTLSEELMVRMLLRRRGDKLRAVVDECIDAVRQQLRLSAAAQGHTLNDYATTVVGIVARGSRGLIFHIGDGAGVAFAPDGSVRSASTTREQEYANETYFVTDELWREHLRFTAATGFRSVAIMTDGVTPFAIGGEGPKSEFFDPVLRYLQAHPGHAVLGLQRMLDRDEAQAQVGDDKTLLWAFASSVDA